jgi:phage/plasmid-like protein (TIGR03299 family)
MSTETITRQAPVDVNARFMAERLAQVANIKDLMSDEGQARYIAEQTARFDERVKAGELVALGSGRYQSTQGWDRGEVWQVRSINGQSLVLPEHELDIDPVTKRVRLYSSTPAWHGLGQVIPGGITDIDEVIRLGQLDVPAVSIPVPKYRVKGLPGSFEAPGQFILANGDTGEYWGMVGKVHKNLPVRGSFEFLENLLGQNGIVWESAGLMGNGRRVFVSCKLPGGVVIDAEGIADYSDIFAVVQDARDGSAAYRAMVTPWRPACGNTNRFALRDALAIVALRHTSGLPGRIAQAQQVLGLTVKYAAEFGAEETTLAQTKVTMAETEALLAEFISEPGKGTAVYGARNKPEESTRTRLSNDRREDALNERIGTERKRVGDSLFMVEQVATGYLGWDKVRKGTDAASRWTARIEAELAGQDDDKKSAVHTRLMQVATNR